MTQKAFLLRELRFQIKNVVLLYEISKTIILCRQQYGYCAE